MKSNWDMPKNLGRIFALIFLVLIIYAQSVSFDFISIDVQDYLLSNPEVQKGLTLGGIGYAFVTMQTGDWQPLVWISWMMDCQLFGMNAGAHHLMNVFYHMVNVLLLFWVLYEMTGSVWKSWMVAAIWAVHPMHVESVAWVAGRKDTLSGLFWLLTMLAYTRHVKQKGKFRWVIIFYVCAVLSKPMVVTLPFVLLLLDYWPLKRKEKLSELIKEKTSLFLLSAFSCFMAYQANALVGGIRSLEKFGFMERIANAIYAYALYLKKTFFPVDLAYFYPHPFYPIVEPIVLISLVLLLVITLAAVRQLQQKPFFAVGWFWFLGVLLPVIGLMQAGDQGMADRYSYLPHIGLFIGLVWFAGDLITKQISKQTITGAFLILIVLASNTALAFQQTQTWKSSLILFEHAKLVTKNNWFAAQNLVYEYAKAGQLEKAFEQVEEVLKIQPEDPDALNNRGNLYLRTDKLDLARKDYEKAYALDPKHLEALTNLAALDAREGKFDDAIAQYYRAINLRPGYSKALLGLGYVYLQQNMIDQALFQFSKVIKTNPRNAEAHFMIGNTYVKSGDPEKALFHYQEATRISPDHIKAQVNKAALYLQMGDMRMAKQSYQQVLQLDPQNQKALEKLQELS